MTSFHSIPFTYKHTRVHYSLGFSSELQIIYCHFHFQVKKLGFKSSDWLRVKGSACSWYCLAQGHGWFCYNVSSFHCSWLNFRKEGTSPIWQSTTLSRTGSEVCFWELGYRTVWRRNSPMREGHFGDNSQQEMSVGWGCSSVARNLLSIHGDLVRIPETVKKKKKSMWPQAKVWAAWRAG